MGHRYENFPLKAQYKMEETKFTSVSIYENLVTLISTFTDYKEGKITLDEMREFLSTFRKANIEMIDKINEGCVDIYAYIENELSKVK